MIRISTNVLVVVAKFTNCSADVFSLGSKKNLGFLFFDRLNNLLRRALQEKPLFQDVLTLVLFYEEQHSNHEYKKSAVDFRNLTVP